LAKKASKESYVESTFCAWVECHEGWYALKLLKRVGWPDRFIVGPGAFYFIEFKKPGEKPEPIQKHVHKLLRKIGLKVYVCETIEAGKEIFRRNF
jgi:hypothetical protein